ncbi:unnamed protein product [Soboliphyme baturini]|uniref:Secreted protein n=1 Tax=Soboliphyme baturini TaxID=241478 RepID=A0A183J534_9BILA|nr:unnamed protein product [Soboliphyme baturini]
MRCLVESLKHILMARLSDLSASRRRSWISFRWKSAFSSVADGRRLSLNDRLTSSNERGDDVEGG